MQFRNNKYRGHMWFMVSKSPDRESDVKSYTCVVRLDNREALRSNKSFWRFYCRFINNN